MAIQIPTEILYDILLRLDVLELCKFRCVSKSWKVLISNPSFVKSHIQRSIKKTRLLLIQRGRKLLKNPSGPWDADSLMRLMRYDDGPFCGITHKFPRYMRRLLSIRPFNQDSFSTRGGGGFIIRQHKNPFGIDRSGDSIISCCGGLILLASSFGQTTKLSLMNPVSNRIKKLPLISEPDTHHFHYRSSYGLGYSNSMEFKVVRFFNAKNGYGCDVLVLNDSPTWERLYDDDLPKAWGNGTFAGGSVFFPTGSVLLEFDVESNKVSLVNYPPCWDNSARDFIEINGELGMSNRENTHKTKVIEIWILKDKENSVWMNTYSIKIRVHPNPYMIMPLYFVDEDTLFIRSSGSVFMCDRNGCHFQEIATPHEGWDCFYWENLSLF